MSILEKPKNKLEEEIGNAKKDDAKKSFSIKETGIETKQEKMINYLLQDNFPEYPIENEIDLKKFLEKLYEPQKRYFAKEGCDSMHCGATTNLVLRALAGKKEITGMEDIFAFRSNAEMFTSLDEQSKDSSIKDIRNKFSKYFEETKRATQLSDGDIRFMMNRIWEVSDVRPGSSRNFTMATLDGIADIGVFIENNLSKEEIARIANQGIENEMEEIITDRMLDADMIFDIDKLDSLLDIVYEPDEEELEPNHIKKTVELTKKFYKELDFDTKKLNRALSDLSYGWGHSVALVEMTEPNEKKQEYIIDLNSDQFGDKFDQVYLMKKGEATDMGYFTRRPTPTNKMKYLQKQYGDRWDDEYLSKHERMIKDQFTFLKKEMKQREIEGKDLT